MKVLSVTGPWAWAIVHAGKDVENRSWPVPDSVGLGPIAIHMSKCQSKRQRLEIADQIREIMDPHCFDPPPVPEDIMRGSLEGHIVGVVEVVGCVRDSVSPWAQWGEWHWQLARPRAVEPVAVKGKLGLWRYGDPLALSAPPCPRCRSLLLTNGHRAWCSHVECRYGLSPNIVKLSEVEHG